MCTAAAYRTRDFYFGRTLDHEDSYGEEITIAPRGYPFRFRAGGTLPRHYAMIGMAHVAQGYPLYYDAVNEKGLGMAGLNFVGNAVYQEPEPGRYNVETFEFIPWILGRCATVGEARAQLGRLDLTGGAFDAALPAARLHWIVADKEETIVVEPMKDGLRVYDDPAGILTNDPPFDEQMFNLNNYMALSPCRPRNLFSSKLDLAPYSRGMGALGLPGDLSSQSRFVRAAFVCLNSVSGDSEEESVSQFFHILNSVEQQRGCCEVGPGVYEYTIYTSCCNADRGIYYYTTYGDHQISAVDLHRTDLDGVDLVRYPLVCGEQIRFQN